MKPTTTEKSAMRSAPKVFDVAHPGKGKPSATSRPVIVTNRPMLQDPMVSSQSDSEIKLSPAPVKVIIKPLAETDERTESTKAPTKAKKDKTIAELAAEKTTEVKIIQDKPDDTKSDDEPEAVAATEPETEKLADEPKEPEAKETETETESTEKPAKSEEKSETDTTDTTDESTDKPADDTLTVEDTKAAKETAALEAEAKKQEEINALVVSKEFFLPINAIERRRSKVVAGLGLMLIIALGFLLFDLLLDVGFLRINGIKPLTHFFSA